MESSLQIYKPYLWYKKQSGACLPFSHHWDGLVIYAVAASNLRLSFTDWFNQNNQSAGFLSANQHAPVAWRVQPTQTSTTGSHWCGGGGHTCFSCVLHGGLIRGLSIKALQSQLLVLHGCFRIVVHDVDGRLVPLSALGVGRRPALVWPIGTWQRTTHC